jgi:hypothetical protein
MDTSIMRLNAGTLVSFEKFACVDVPHLVTIADGSPKTYRLLSQLQLFTLLEEPLYLRFFLLQK